MHTRNLLLASLLVALYGCQPETPAQPPAAPAAEPATAPAEPAAPVAMMPASAPAETVAPAPVEKAAPAVQQKPAAVKETPSTAPAAATPTPAQAVVAPAAKVEATAAAVTAVPAKTMPSEADAMALAKKSGCLVCHAIDKKVVGPAWKDVAAKYRGDAGAEARLMDKIAKGGGGVWGSIAMPPNSRLGDADRQTLARFVLSLK